MTQAKVAKTTPAERRKTLGLWSGGSLHRFVPVEIETGALRTQLALYNAKVPAGSPVEADDTIAQRTTLGEILLHNPRDSFLLRVTGDSMVGAGIEDGDLLTVDRKLAARNGDVVVATIDGQTTVKTLQRGKDGTVTLQPQNDKHQPIRVGPENEFTLLGVVTNVIRSLY